MRDTKFEETIKEKAWNKAMNEQMTVTDNNHTWELLDRPKEKDIIGLKLILKIKYNKYDSIQKHKDQLVAKG